MIDAGYLRALGAHGLARLMELRPDALAAPVPEALSDVAERLSTVGSVVTGLRRLDRPTLEVTEAIAALGGDTDRSTLARLLGSPDGDALDVALATLTEHALLRNGPRITLIPTARGAFGRPLGLGIPVAEALDTRTAADLKSFARHLNIVAPSRKAEILAAVTAALRDPDQVTAMVDAAPPATRDLLRRLAETGEELDVFGFDDYLGSSRRGAEPHSWAVERGMLVREGWGHGLSMPAEVALALRGSAYTAPFNPVAPQVSRATVERATVAQAAAASGSAIVRLTGAMLNDASKAPLTTLKSGGIGVREARRLAKLLVCGEDEINLCIDLASGGGLLATAGTRAAPTAAYDVWVRHEPPDRLAQLVAVWWKLAHVPLSSADDPVDDAETAHRLRSALLAEVAREPSAVTDPEQLVSATIWRSPAAFGIPGPVEEQLLACWREATLLGLTGAGAISDAGRALLAGTDVADALTDVGSSERTVRLQADLTAVVAGAPAPELAELLDLVADQESRGAASIWRLSPSSVRRALDAGLSAPELRELLSAVAVGGLPQSMAYLLDDVARKHGTVRASAVTCCLRSDDTALLAEIVRDRRLRKLGLRLLAPTVLTGEASLTETLTALRGAGYAPVTEAPDGQTIIERREAVRAAAPTPRTHAPQFVPRKAAPPNPAEIADRLLAAPDEPSATATPLFAALRAGSAQLSNAEIRMLAYAIDQQQPAKIGYINNAGNGSVRVIDEIEFTGGSLAAWCRLREDTRWFSLSRIVAVEPVTESAV